MHTTRLLALWPTVFEVVKAGWQDLKDIRDGAEKPERLPGGGKRWLLVWVLRFLWLHVALNLHPLLLLQLSVELL